MVDPADPSAIRHPTSAIRGLVLSRYAGQAIVIGPVPGFCPRIVVGVTRIKRGRDGEQDKVGISIDAPRSIPIMRDDAVKPTASRPWGSNNHAAKPPP
jgi:sRNA-binding carbon storage regulator CsrA